MAKDLEQKSFATLLVEFERLGALLVEDAEKLRCRIWDMMAYHKVMLGHHVNDLREHAKSLCIDGPNWIDKWLDYWFMPVQMFGEDYRDIFKAHADGMSRREFMHTPAAVWIQDSKRSKHAKQVPSIIPSPPTDQMSEREAEIQWKARAEAFAADNAKLRRRLSELEHIVLRYDTILRKQQALLARTPVMQEAIQ